MIQRIQSIFLFSVAAVMAGYLFVKVWVKEAEGNKALLNAFSLTHSKVSPAGETVIDITPTYYLAALAIISAGIALYSLFSYNNRLKQMKLNLINTLAIAVFLGLNVWMVFKGEQLFSPEVKGNFGVGFILPAAALVCNRLATTFIRRDEKLVRDADRLR